MIRRLDPIVDEVLLRQAFAWTAATPQWHRDMDSIFGPQTVDDFLLMSKEPQYIHIGIFDGGLIGLLILEWITRDVFNAHLCAKRGASLETLTIAAARVLNDFLNLGMVEGTAWVAEKNAAVRKLCGTIGMRDTGIVMFKGSYKGRLTKWIKYSIEAETAVNQAAA